jgi:FtsH-binding integral membrane protein
VFLSTTALFGLFAAAGYFTKTDLSKLGSILMIGLFGIVIAGLINFFVGSQTMDYVISFIGVVIFTGLTAYDVQKIKNMGEMVEEGETMSKMAIMGALSLYLDFINLFLFLLRLFGGSRD